MPRRPRRREERAAEELHQDAHAHALHGLLVLDVEVADAKTERDRERPHAHPHAAVIVVRLLLDEPPAS